MYSWYLFIQLLPRPDPGFPLSALERNAFWTWFCFGSRDLREREASSLSLLGTCSLAQVFLVCLGFAQPSF